MFNASSLTLLCVSMYCVTVIHMYTCFESKKLFNKFLLKYDACLYLVVDRFLHNICAYNS